MESGALSIMVPAFVECLVLVGIHSYLGIHVIKRKVIFVDLALAQIAALGATVGFLFGMAPSSLAAFLFSMVFTFIGAGVFAMTRLRNDRVPQEAVIGLVYAMAAAIAILVIDKSPHGAEHIKDLLTGTILWVQWPAIISSAVAYGFVGLFHFLFRRRFIMISEDPEGAFRAGLLVRFWDFLFYVSFGFVITFSVRTAGVLLVFVFLVAPAITAVLLTDRWRSQLLVGWVMGTLVSSCALYLSYAMDLPSGPTVVAFYGVVLLAVSLGVYALKAEQRGRAALKLGLGLSGAIALVGAVWLLGSALGASSWAQDPTHQQVAAMHAGGAGGQLHVGHHHAHHHAHRGPAAAPGGPDQGGPAGEGEEPDPEQRIEALRRAVDAREPGWRVDLVRTVTDPDLPLLFREEALKLFFARAGTTFGYDLSKENNSAAEEKMEEWVKDPAGQEVQR